MSSSDGTLYISVSSCGLYRPCFRLLSLNCPCIYKVTFFSISSTHHVSHVCHQTCDALVGFLRTCQDIEVLHVHLMAVVPWHHYDLSLNTSAGQYHFVPVLWKAHRFLPIEGLNAWINEYITQREKHKQRTFGYSQYHGQQNHMDNKKHARIHAISFNSMFSIFLGDLPICQILTGCPGLPRAATTFGLTQQSQNRRNDGVACLNSSILEATDLTHLMGSFLGGHFWGDPRRCFLLWVFSFCRGGCGGVQALVTASAKLPTSWEARLFSQRLDRLRRKKAPHSFGFLCQSARFAFWEFKN